MANLTAFKYTVIVKNKNGKKTSKSWYQEEQAIEAAKQASDFNKVDSVTIKVTAILDDWWD